MAIVRCQDHPPRTANYAIAVEPVGYPDTALVCGRGDKEHTRSGWVFLKPEELKEYNNGERVFGLWGPDSGSTAAKVKVSDDPVEGLDRWTKDQSITSTAV